MGHHHPHLLGLGGELGRRLGGTDRSLRNIARRLLHGHGRFGDLFDTQGLFPGSLGDGGRLFADAGGGIDDVVEIGVHPLQGLGAFDDPLDVLVEQFPCITGRNRRPVGETLDLVGHHRETGAILTGPRRFDGGIQGQEIGLERDRIDGVDDRTDGIGVLFDLLHIAGQFDKRLQRLARFLNVLVHESLGAGGEFRGLAAHGRHLLQGCRGFLDGGRLGGGTLCQGLAHRGDRTGGGRHLDGIGLDTIRHLGKDMTDTPGDQEGKDTTGHHHHQRCDQNPEA